MNILKTLPLIIALGFGSSVNAEEVSIDASEFKKHTFGAQLSIGGAEFKDSNHDGDGVAQFYTYYNYAFNQHFALEVGLNGGADVDDWDCKEVNDGDWYCSDDDKSYFGLLADEVEYHNFIVAAKGTLPLSQRNSLYGKIGGQYYDYDIKRSDRTIISDSDIGLFLEAGWQYRWDFGLGLAAGWQYLDMGDLSTYTLTTGVSYQF